MSLRILSLNLWALSPSISRDNGPRMRAIGSALAGLELDAAALQEAWHEESRDQLIAASRSSGLVHVWQPPDGLQSSGLLVLSRWPIRRAELHRFELRGVAERLLEADYLGHKGYAVLELDTGDGPITLINTHLQAAYTARELDPHVGLRVGQVVQLATSLRALRQPLILAGDLNFEEHHDEYRVLTGLTGIRDVARSLAHPQDTMLPTNPYVAGRTPAKRIDFLFSRAGQSQTLVPVSVTRVLDGEPPAESAAAAYSDHAGVVAEFELAPGSGGVEVTLDLGAVQLARELLIAGLAAVEARMQSQRVLGALGLATLPAGLLAARSPSLSRRRLLANSLRSLAALIGTAGALRLGLTETLRPAELRGFEAALARLEALEA